MSISPKIKVFLESMGHWLSENKVCWLNIFAFWCLYLTGLHFRVRSITSDLLLHPLRGAQQMKIKLVVKNDVIEYEWRLMGPLPHLLLE